MLESVRGLPFRDYVEEVIVPTEARIGAEAIIKRFAFSGRRPTLISSCEVADEVSDDFAFSGGCGGAS